MPLDREPEIDHYDEDADLSGLDRGDELPDEPEAPEAQPEVEEPVAEEPEAEAEQEQEPEPEPAQESEEPEPEPEEPRQDHRIPKQRFDEVNERRKAAERRAQELEAKLSQHDPSKAADFDFEGQEREYMNAVIDGDTDKALKIRGEIRAAEQAAYTSLAQQRADQARESTKAELEFTSTVSELNEQFPAFDPNSEAYNQDLVDEVLDLHGGFVARGYSPAAALRKAAGYVAKAQGLEAPKEEPKSLDQAPRAKKPDIGKKLKAAAQQPPQQAGRSAAEEDSIDLDNLSDEEFDALPEATLRRLRGDV